MLGEKYSEEIGQVIGTRALPSEGGSAKMEITFQASGTIIGLHATDVGTYVGTMQSDGTMRGEGQGVIMTEDGGVATWIGHGIGKPTGRGTGVSWRGTVYYKTASPSLARLNGIVGAYEYEVDETNKTEGKLWEWK
jgi:hypothetical protein